MVSNGGLAALGMTPFQGYGGHRGIDTQGSAALHPGLWNCAPSVLRDGNVSGDYSSSSAESPSATSSSSTTGDAGVGAVGEVAPPMGE
jgi:hypothetical protein